MSEFQIGDAVKITDYDDPETYIIDDIKQWKGVTIYHLKNYAPKPGWKIEQHIKKV